jgi:hypothetical protein
MIMIRNTMFGLSLLALTAGSAFAAPAKHVVTTRTVAEAPAADTAAPADKAAAPKKEKKAKAEKKEKAAPKAEGETKAEKPAETK